MNKNAVLVLIPVMLYSIMGCEETENGMDPGEQTGMKEITVENFQSVQVDSKVSLIANAHGDQNTVTIQAPSDLIDLIGIESVNGVLVISTSDTSDTEIALDDSVKVIIPDEDLEEIVLEANQEAIFNGPPEILEKISIQTKGSSILHIMNLKTNNLDLDMRGNSEVSLMNEADSSVLDSLVITDTTAQVISEDSVMLGDSSFVVGDSLEVVENAEGDTEEIIVYTESMVLAHLTAMANVSTTGDVMLDAGKFPVKEMEIHLVGNSEAVVNVTEVLSGSGNGNSLLRYYGDPVIEFTVQGNAKIEPVSDPEE